MGLCSLPGLRPNYCLVMAISFQRTSASMLPLPGLLYSVPLTPQQATVDPCLCWSLLDTHRQVWLFLLWGHCSFLLGPGAHKVLFVPSKHLSPQSCVSPVIKSHWPSKSNHLGVLSPFVRRSSVSPGGEIFLTPSLTPAKSQ